MWSAQFYKHKHPRRFITSGGLGTMGFGLPAAIGAQLEVPDPTVVDVRADGVAHADLEAIVAAFGDKAVNRSSTTWRALSEADRATDPVDLLAAHPTLRKRPVIEEGGQMTLGWAADAQATWLGKPAGGD